MSRTKRVTAVALATSLLFAACSDKKDEPVATSGNNEATSATTAAPATSAPKETTTTTAVDTSKDEELAKGALIGTSDLPAGEWTAGEIESNSGESGDGSADFSTVESCKKLVDDQKAIEAKSSGRASISFTQGMDEQVQIGNDVELWPSADTVKQIGKITDASGFQDCMTDVLSDQMSEGGGGPTPTGVQVSAFNVGVDADDVGVDFITGVNVRFGLDMSDMGVDDASGLVRFVFIGAGRGLASVSVMAFEVPGMTESVDPESLDLTKTVEAAARNLVKVAKAN